MIDIEKAIEAFKSINELYPAYSQEHLKNELAVKALEKQIPQFPSCCSGTEYKCPVCGGSIQVEQAVGGIKVHADKFCRNCGQALVEIEIISE